MMGRSGRTPVSSGVRKPTRDGEESCRMGRTPFGAGSFRSWERGCQKGIDVERRLLVVSRNSKKFRWLALVLNLRSSAEDLFCEPHGRKQLPAAVHLAESIRLFRVPHDFRLTRHLIIQRVTCQECSCGVCSCPGPQSFASPGGTRRWSPKRLNRSGTPMRQAHRGPRPFCSVLLGGPPVGR